MWRGWWPRWSARRLKPNQPACNRKAHPARAFAVGRGLAGVVQLQRRQHHLAEQRAAAACDGLNSPISGASCRSTSIRTLRRPSASSSQPSVRPRAQEAETRNDTGAPCSTVWPPRAKRSGAPPLVVVKDRLAAIEGLAQKRDMAKPERAPAPILPLELQVEIDPRRVGMERHGLARSAPARSGSRHARSPSPSVDARSGSWPNPGR